MCNNLPSGGSAGRLESPALANGARPLRPGVKNFLTDVPGAMRAVQLGIARVASQPPAPHKHYPCTMRRQPHVALSLAVSSHLPWPPAGIPQFHSTRPRQPHSICKTAAGSPRLLKFTDPTLPLLRPRNFPSALLYCVPTALPAPLPGTQERLQDWSLPPHRSLGPSFPTLPLPRTLYRSRPTSPSPSHNPTISPQGPQSSPCSTPRAHLSHFFRSFPIPLVPVLRHLAPASLTCSQHSHPFSSLQSTATSHCKVQRLLVPPCTVSSCRSQEPFAALAILGQVEGTRPKVQLLPASGLQGKVTTAVHPLVSSLKESSAPLESTLILEDLGSQNTKDPSVQPGSYRTAAWAQQQSFKELQ